MNHLQFSRSGISSALPLALLLSALFVPTATGFSTPPTTASTFARRGVGIGFRPSVGLSSASAPLVSQRWSGCGLNNNGPLRGRIRRSIPCLGAKSSSSEGDDGSENTSQQVDASTTTGSPLPSASTGERPSWALPWMPTWLVAMRPALQFVVGLLLYMFHLRVLTQHGLTFPVQLIPNDEGWFQGVGFDTLAGMAAFGGLVWIRRASVKAVEEDGADGKRTFAVPSLWADPTGNEAPWKIRAVKSRNSDDASKRRQPHARTSSIVAFVLLTMAYFSTGRFALFFENALYAAAGYGVPLTVAMHRSLCVLLGHLAWVVSGSAILAGVLSPKPFFGGGWTRNKAKAAGAVSSTVDGTSSSEKTKKKGKIKFLSEFRWYTNKWDTYWLWWTIGGYFVSAWLFNIADFLNQIILPPAVFEFAQEGVVSQLINPENNDLAASIVGYIAPCISAPWWEEVLYRGYLLPALNLFMGFWPSVFASGVLFSVHHLSTTGAIPLAVLGWTWAALYAKSGNILVTMLIHCMWNSRVFLGSWLGL